MKNALVGLSIVGLASTLSAQSIRLGSVPPDPAARAEDVLVLRQFDRTRNEGYGTVLAAEASDAQQRLRGLADLAIVEPVGFAPDVQLGDRALRAAEMTLEAQRVLNLSVGVGRLFAPVDLQSDQRVAILIDGAWRSHFNSRADVVGRMGATARDGSRIGVTIVGVLSPTSAAALPELDPDAEIIVLSRIRLDVPPADQRWFAPVLRLRPGVSVEQAQAALNRAPADAQVEPRSPNLVLRLETYRR